MPFPQPPESRKLGPPVAIDDRARDNIRFIRETMERAASFTAVPGWGGIAVGITAAGAAVIAAQQTSTVNWLLAWGVEAGVAVAIAIWTSFSKARRAGGSLMTGPGRRFVYGMAPPLLVGALLTVLLVRMGATVAVPGVWLLLYGTGIVTGGAFSIRIVPLMGLCFMVLGAVALFYPHGGDVFLGGGFGGLHIIFGAVIASKYGG